MTISVKSQSASDSKLESLWHVIDAQGKTLGRLSSDIAKLLQGKHKPTYVSYQITGDFVVVVNAEKVRVTGKKLEQKIYYRYSGYHGGLKEQKLSDLLKKNPTRVIRQAVKGMLPKNSLGRVMLSRLKLYVGESHPHEAQVNVRPKKRIVDQVQKSSSKATGSDISESDDSVAKTPSVAKGRSRTPSKTTKVLDAKKEKDTDGEGKAKKSSRTASNKIKTSVKSGTKTKVKTSKRPKPQGARASAIVDADSTSATSEDRDTEEA